MVRLHRIFKGLQKQVSLDCIDLDTLEKFQYQRVVRHGTALKQLWDGLWGSGEPSALKRRFETKVQP